MKWAGAVVATVLMAASALGQDVTVNINVTFLAACGSGLVIVVRELIVRGVP